MCLGGYCKRSTMQYINHIGDSSQGSDSISRIIITMMISGTIFFEYFGQSLRWKTTIINPTGEAFQILHFLRRILHNQYPGKPAYTQRVENVGILTLAFRHVKRFVTHRVPLHGSSCRFLSSCFM